MPWTPSDGPARHTHKANTPKKKRQWSDIANSVLERTGDEGRAVRTANGVIRRQHGLTHFPHKSHSRDGR